MPEAAVILSRAQQKRIHLRRDRPSVASRPVEAISALPNELPEDAAVAHHQHGADIVVDTWLEQGATAALDMLFERVDQVPSWQIERVDMPLARRLRERMATAADDIYETFVSEVAKHRSTSRQRVLAFYLAPTEPSFAVELKAAEDVDELRWLLLAVSDVAQLDHITLMARNRRLDAFTADTPATLADACGVDFLPYLHDWLQSLLGGSAAAKQLLALAYDQQTPESFAAVAGPLATGSGAYAHREKIFARGFRQAPELAAKVFLPVLATGSRFALENRHLAEVLVLDHPALVDAERSQYDDATAALIDTIRAEQQDRETRDQIELSLVPPLLASPPWEDRARQPKRQTIVDVEPLPIAAQMRWADGERDAWRGNQPAPPPLGDPADWESLSRVQRYHLLRFGDVEVMRPYLTDFTDISVYHRDYAARFELDLSPAIRDFVHRRKEAWETPTWALVVPFGLPDLAAPIVEVYGKSTRASRFAMEWLLRHPELAANHLVPRVVSPTRKGRSVADAALRLIARVDEQMVRTVAARFGDEVEASIEQFLAVDPLDVLPSRMPSTPDYVRPGALDAPTLISNGLPLPAPAVANVVTMIALSKETEYAGIDQVRELCEPDSLAQFALSLHRAWTAAGRVRKDAWLAFGIDLFGNDSIVPAIAGVISKEVSVSDDERRDQIDLLSRLGSDDALAALFHISTVIKRKVTARDARKKVDEMAELRGLTADELADRLIRSFDLDDSGSMTLDFGSRAFIVTFDETLTPVIATDDGVPRKTLPKANKDDDPEMAAQAHAEFKRLKKDVRQTAKEQIKRFERAMVLGRRWSRGDWERDFTGHPLMRHLVRRLVWVVYSSADPGGEIQAAFRIAEDGSFADESDSTFDLAADAIVGVAHPRELSALASWSEIFADYEIGQPFEQLGRAVYRADAVPEGIDVTGGLHLVGNPLVPHQRILGLTSRGWDNEHVGSSTSNYSRQLRSGRVSLTLEPGFEWGRSYEDQRIQPVRFDPGSAPVDFSELMRDLVWLGRLA